MKHDIKEILELLKAIEVLAVSGAKIAKDGKIGIDDLGVLIGLMRQLPDLQAGFKGVKAIPNELSDLEQQETKLIVEQVFSMLGHVKDVLK